MNTKGSDHRSLARSTAGLEVACAAEAVTFSATASPTDPAPCRWPVSPPRFPLGGSLPTST